MFSFTWCISIESKHEVTILGGLNEFVVKFYGPQGSKYMTQPFYKNKLMAHGGEQWNDTFFWSGGRDEQI